MKHHGRPFTGALLLGAAGFLVLPWYALADTVLGAGWMRNWTGLANAPALVQVFVHGRWWLLPAGLLLAASWVLLVPALSRGARANGLLATGALGFTYTLLQGFAIDTRGWSSRWLAAMLEPLAGGQGGMGAGAFLVLASFTLLFAFGLALRGFFKGDLFIAGAVVTVGALVGMFVFFPVGTVLLQALAASDGTLSLPAFAARLFTGRVWSLACVVGPGRCGVAWNTLALALLCATCCTALGLAFALVATRTAFRYKRLLRLVSLLPIITPPFVIGLGIILLFGRSGFVNQGLEWAFGLSPTRWIYGLQGVLLAQVFAFTPIAFLILIGVVEGVAPSLEEAAQTLRADRWRTFIDISLPLMRPGLANAFLISFIESIADFGNPILLGGNFGVLSTEIFFSVVGAQLDPGKAATLGMVLLAFALAAFVAQRRVLGRKSYASMAGKGDGGRAPALPDGIRRLCYALAAPWMLLTLVIYAMALTGGFVENWGRNYTPTWSHYVKAFGVEWGANGVLWTGAAWDSLRTTVTLSAIAAPLTAALGLLAAYLLTRTRFVGRTAFEFGTMLAFAIPGTVIGIAYILAFNVPPLELTGTALILVLCNVFRNMPVGVRAGMASMAQIDPSLDEASATLRAGGATTLRRVLLPLLKPALVAALVYSFVRAMTTLSAVIFLISAQYEWATTYIINRVINGEYGVAIAYCSVLIVLALAGIGIIHLLVGGRRLGRRDGPAAPPGVPGAVAGTAA